MLVLALACSHSADTTETDPADTDVVDTDDTDVAQQPLDPSAVKAVIDTAVRTLRRSKATGAQIAVWLDGRVYYIGAAGTANQDGTRSIDENTMFQVGSDTKKMTAIAVLQAVERGDVALDDPLATALPSLRFSSDHPPGTDITLHQLLSQQSGLYDYTPWDDDPADAALSERAYGVFAAGEPAMNPPGLMWNYSNPNFSLAGLAVEVADGRPYADILEQDLFAPLALTRTVARLSEVDENAASGRGFLDFVPESPFDSWGQSTWRIGSVEPADQIDNAFLRPAGMVWSTASDMCRLAGFLIDGDPAVLSDDLRAQLVAPHAPLYPSWDVQSYGYGMFLSNGFTLGADDYVTPLWAHGGNTLTMTSLFYALPERRMAVCILSNGYADDFSAAAAEALTRWGNLPTPGVRPDPPLPLEDLSKYAGFYTDPTVGRLVVEADDGGLTIDMPDLEARGHGVSTRLIPSYLDMFVFQISGTDYDLTYYDGYLRNRAFVGRRVERALSVELQGTTMKFPAATGGDPALLPAIPSSLSPILRR